MGQSSGLATLTREANPRGQHRLLGTATVPARKRYQINKRPPALKLRIGPIPFLNQRFWPFLPYLSKFRSFLFANGFPLSLHSSPILSLFLCFFLWAFWTCYVKACELALRVVAESHRVAVVFERGFIVGQAGALLFVPEPVPPTRTGKRRGKKKRSDSMLQTL